MEQEKRVLFFFIIIFHALFSAEKKCCRKNNIYKEKNSPNQRLLRILCKLRRSRTWGFRGFFYTSSDFCFQGVCPSTSHGFVIENQKKKVLECIPIKRSFEKKHPKLRVPDWHAMYPKNIRKLVMTSNYLKCWQIIAEVKRTLWKDPFESFCIFIGLKVVYHHLKTSMGKIVIKFLK